MSCVYHVCCGCYGNGQNGNLNGTCLLMLLDDASTPISLCLCRTLSYYIQLQTGWWLYGLSLFSTLDLFLYLLLSPLIVLASVDIYMFHYLLLVLYIFCETLPVRLYVIMLVFSNIIGLYSVLIVYGIFVCLCGRF